MPSKYTYAQIEAEYARLLRYAPMGCTLMEEPWEFSNNRPMPGNIVLRGPNNFFITADDLTYLQNLVALRTRLDREKPRAA